MKSWEWFTKRVNQATITQLRKCNIFGYDLKIIGVTGTLGKTTVAELIAGYLNHIGKRTFYTGTSGLYCKAANYAQVNFPSTAPTSADMLKAFIHGAYFYGCEYLVIEITAETIASGVYKDLDFDYISFTNLKPNVVRSFRNDDEYFNSKLSIFVNNFVGCAVTSEKNTQLVQTLQAMSQPTATFNFDFSVDPATCKLQILLNDKWYNTNLLSSINAENVALAYFTLLEMGLNMTEMTDYLLTAVISGRLEHFELQGRQFIIDTGYGGTEGLGPFFRELKTQKNIISVLSTYFFDNENDVCANISSKRWERAQLINQYSSKVVITATHRRAINKDPQREQRCLDQLKRGAPKGIQVYNRIEAIKWACENSAPGDIILIIGMGSESWWQFKSESEANSTEYLTDKDFVKLLYKTDFNLDLNNIQYEFGAKGIPIKVPWMDLTAVYNNKLCGWKKISINNNKYQ